MNAIFERSIEPAKEAGTVGAIDNDAGVVGAIVVEANEVLPIEGEQRSISRGGEREHLVIRHGPAGFARVDDGQDIVAQSAQFQDTGHAASFSSIWRLISSLCDRTYPQAFTRSSARSVG